VSPDATLEQFQDQCDLERSAVEQNLEERIEELASEHEGMREAIAHSLLGGGKRLRPILCLWTHDLVGGTRRDIATDTACAVECVHTYSLIHDDLPCMDDDDFRRGKSSSHKRFGEATAVLAGDALLTLAFQIIGTIPERRAGAGVEEVLETAKLLSLAAGTGGLITGQALDLAGTGGRGGLEAVRKIHQNKTARLIATAMEIGAVVGGAGTELRDSIRRVGTLAGEAFQIVDDVLDREKDRDTLGKTPGKDEVDGKLTYPSVVGIEKARGDAAALAASAKSMLPEGKNAPLLMAMIDFIVARGA
jgi:geranylgeranyl diphosphate synthase type II